MAITQTGTTLQLTTNNNSANSSETITVPADAEIAIVGLCGYSDPAQTNFLTGGDATLTLGGDALTAVTGGDASTSFWQAGMWYRKSPLTGSRSLAWNFNSTGTLASGKASISVTFWKGIDTTNTPRSTNGAQGSGNPRTSGTITASNGDKIVSYVGTFANAANLSYIWTGSVVTPTELADGELTGQNDADGCWAYTDATGDQTVSATDGTGSEGGMLSIVLIPAAAGGGTVSGVAASAGLGTATGVSPEPVTEKLFYRRRR